MDNLGEAVENSGIPEKVRSSEEEEEIRNQVERFDQRELPDDQKEKKGILLADGMLTPYGLEEKKSLVNEYPVGIEQIVTSEPTVAREKFDEIMVENRKLRREIARLKSLKGSN